MNRFIRLASMAAAIALIACTGSNNKTPDPEVFAPYIKSFSGSMVPHGRPISVSLQGDIVSRAEEPLFEFTPDIKGTQNINGSAAEFLPQAGAIKPGRIYTCRFNLGKALGLKDKKLQTFEFSFYAPKKTVSIELGEIHTTLRTAAIHGTLSVNSSEDYGLGAEAGGIDATISKTGDYEYSFVIDSIKRDQEDRTVSIAVKASASDVVLPREIQVTIPGTRKFKVESAVLSESAPPCITVTFSDPLAPVPAGLANVLYAGRTTTTRKDNILKVYYENMYADEVTLELDENIKNTEGKALGEYQKIQLSPNASKPAVRISVTGNIVPEASKVILPFSSVNLSAVDVKIVKVFTDNILSFLQVNEISGDSQVRRSGRLVYDKTIRLDTDPNINLHSWQDFSLDLSGMFRKEPGAIYMVHFSFKKEYSLYGKTGPVESVPNTFEEPSPDKDTQWDNPSGYYWSFWDDDIDWIQYNWQDRDDPETPSYYMVSSRFPTINLIASDIGLIAKKSESDRLWIAAASITSSEPISGADIYVYNYQLQKIGSGRTSASGLAEIRTSGVPFIATARKDGSTNYLRIQQGGQNSLSRFDVGGRQLEKGLKAYIFGERGVWRPGDTLHLVMLLQDKGKNLPDEHPVTMELYSPAGQFYAKKTSFSGTDGFYRFDVPTKPDDPTGIWNSYFKVGGSSFHKSVRIETIKPNRLKINTAIEGGMLSAGQTAKIKMASAWLTGPAAKGLAAKVSMVLSSNAGFFNGHKEYLFENPLGSIGSGPISLLSTRLDQNGTTEAAVTIPHVYDAPGMLRATLISSVEENGGDESITSTTVPFSPYSNYVGIKAPKTDTQWYETGRNIDFSVIDVDSSGRITSGRILEYTIYKIGWSWWWENSASDLYAYVNSSSAKVVSSGSLTTGTGPSKVTLRVEYPDWGRYLVYVKDPGSGHASGLTVTVDWPDYLGRAGREDPDALNMLSFSLGKTEYSVGETASVFIPAAAGSGNALVSLENGGSVISSKWVKLSGENDTVFKFKVEDDMAPNFFVHISLVQPYGNVGNDLPIRLYGVQPVLVSRKDSHLSPVISMPDSVHPEEKFTIGVREAQGKKMTYMLLLVDEGLLDLTSFKTPDPWNYMYSKEALGIATWDIYDNVAGTVAGKFGKMLSVGGDDELTPGAAKDNRFNPIVKVMGPFTLSKGTARHEVRLPMYVGSIRVMVVAAHDGTYGNTEKAVTVKSPLMAVTTLPRVLGTGDEVSVPVNIFALEGGIGAVNVSIEASGAAGIEGPDRKTVSFDAPGDKMTEFRLKGQGSGTARITVTATAAGHKTRETFSLPVHSAVKPMTSVQYHTIPAKGTITLSTVSKRTEGAVTITSFPAIDYIGACSYAVDYPYSCTEQLSSRGLVLLHSMDKLPEDKASKAKETLTEIIDNLYGRQLADGGFAYWSGDVASNTWVSSMAGVLLSEASAKGFEVSQEVISSWMSFQNTAIRNFRSSHGKNLRDLDQAFRLYSLSVAGNADEGAMNRLKENSQTSAQARWMLASAYALSGKKKISADIISGIEQGFAGYEAGENSTFGSEYRDKAIATEALALSGRIGDALASAQQVATLYGPGFTNTQESAFAALALDRVYAVAGSEGVDVRIEGSKAEDVNTSAGVATYTLNPADKELKITNLTSTPAYVSLSQVSAPEAGESIAARSSGLKLNLSFTTADGSQVNPASIKQGTEFTAEIKVSNTGVGQDYEHAALQLLVPAGWEIMADRLYQDTVSAANSYDSQDIMDDASIWYFDLARGMSKTFKIRIRAAYAGSFYLPPATCELMYDPLIHAGTASGKVEVTK